MAGVNGVKEGMFRVVAHLKAGDRAGVVRCLFKHGEGPHPPAYDQASALDLWSYEGNSSVGRIFHKNQAGPNLECAPKGETPLRMCAGFWPAMPIRIAQLMSGFHQRLM